MRLRHRFGGDDRPEQLKRSHTRSVRLLTPDGLVTRTSNDLPDASVRSGYGWGKNMALSPKMFSRLLPESSRGVIFKGCSNSVRFNSEGLKNCWLGNGNLLTAGDGTTVIQISRKSELIPRRASILACTRKQRACQASCSPARRRLRQPFAAHDPVASVR